jgi:hypothetical protein
MASKLAQCQWEETRRLNAYLGERWKPFAVTDGDGGIIVWLRTVVSGESNARCGIARTCASAWVSGQSGSNPPSGVIGYG